MLRDVYCKVSIIWRLLWAYIYALFTVPVVQRKINGLHIPYVYDGRSYIAILHANTVRKWKAMDHDKKDVTINVERYAGPWRDFFGCSVTPKELGYNELTFVIDNNAYCFNSRDIIKI